MDEARSWAADPGEAATNCSPVWVQCLEVLAPGSMADARSRLADPGDEAMDTEDGGRRVVAAGRNW